MKRRYRGGTEAVPFTLIRTVAYEKAVPRRYQGGTVHPHKHCYKIRGGPATPFALYKIKKHSGVGGDRDGGGIEPQHCSEAVLPNGVWGAQ